MEPSNCTCAGVSWRSITTCCRLFGRCSYTCLHHLGEGVGTNTGLAGLLPLDAPRMAQEGAWSAPPMGFSGVVIGSMPVHVPLPTNGPIQKQSNRKQRTHKHIATTNNATIKQPKDDDDCGEALVLGSSRCGVAKPCWLKLRNGVKEKQR